MAFFPVTHICRNGTRASLAIPQCCVYAWVCVEPTAPSMSHFKVLSLPASWHLLTPTIIMLIYIVWLHKVIYAQLYPMSAQRGMLLLLNVLKRTFHDRRIHFISSLFESSHTFHSSRLTLSTKSLKALTKVWRPLPTGKIIAKSTKWTTLLCSWRGDEFRSVSSQSSLAPYRKWQECVLCWKQRARDELSSSFIHS